jgi:hypothetical protein
MATEITGTPTPSTVKQLATQEVQLPKTALLGIFGTAAAPSALILLPKGKTQIVTVGDAIGRGTVLAIGKDGLVLGRNGAQYVMRLPRG